jgi:SNF2 family DNA or RNA helicase
MVIPMNKYERLVYEAIANRIRSYAQNDYLKNVAFVRRLQRGRMIRLRQCVSNASLLRSALRDYKEELIDEESVAGIVTKYELLEIPAKVEHLMTLVSRLTGEGEKVVVWTNFIGTLKLIHRSICELGIGCKMIYGETPVEKTSIHDAATREQIIAEFKDAGSGLQVLLMNPAACAESISLHTASQHAVYYDLSYNLAQYLQSLDRIHRIGGSESKVANYYFLQYADSLDQDIFMNLSEKAERMYSIIEKDYAVYSLDMFEDDGDVEAYNRLFR